MNIRISAQIASIHLRSKMKQTVIASLGVTFGIAMFVFMTSFMTGVNKFLEETALTATPHIHIYNDIEQKRPSIVEEAVEGQHLVVVHHQKPKNEPNTLRNAPEMLRIIQSDPRVLGVSPQLSTQIFVNYGEYQFNGRLVGADLIEEDKLFDLNSKLSQGALEDIFTVRNGIILGVGLAEKLNVSVGDRINITTPQGGRFDLTVAAVLKTGIMAIDNVQAYAPLETVQRVLGKDSRYITDINIKVKDIDRSTEVAREYAQSFGYKADDYETINATLLVSFKLRNIITWAVSVTLLIVAGFGIYNILNMTIYEKMKDIAILKATGFGGGDVKAIFMMQALSIGFAGGSLGLLIGFILSYLTSKVPFESKEMLAMDRLPVNFDPQYYVFALLFGLLTTALAGYFPSRKASKVDPVVIIRG